MEPNTFLGIPRGRLQRDLVGRAAEQHAVQQDAVVTAVRLLAEDAHFERAEATAPGQLIKEPAGRHAVADDRQLLPFHVLNPSPSPSPKRGGEEIPSPPSLAGKGDGGLGLLTPAKRTAASLNSGIR